MTLASQGPDQVFEICSFLGRSEEVALAEEEAYQGFHMPQKHKPPQYSLSPHGACNVFFFASQKWC